MLPNRDSKDDLMAWVKSAVNDPNIAISQQDLDN